MENMTITSRESAPSPVQASYHTFHLLDRLHNESTTQEAAIPEFLANGMSKQLLYDSAALSTEFDDMMRDKFIALDKSKCEAIYQFILATGATTVVEAGTSFGVSTIYLSLAVSRNSPEGLVIATEKEPSKAIKAREYWKEASEIVEKHIQLREGDLLQTLHNLPQIDMLLLDSKFPLPKDLTKPWLTCWVHEVWAPLALPTLTLVQKNLKHGAMVIIDNTISSRERYKDLIDYLRDPYGPFNNLTLPYMNGLELSVYRPLNGHNGHVIS